MEEVILVNERDEELGFMEKYQAHELGKLHRAFSIFIFNTKGEMLIHQRALGKYHSGGLWTNACCSHPRPGENTIDAANRRLFEELSIKCKLEEVFTFTYTTAFDNGLSENEFDHVFFGTYEGPIQPDAREIMDYFYIAPEKLLVSMKTFPQKFTSWFHIAVGEIIRRQSEPGS